MKVISGIAMGAFLLAAIAITTPAGAQGELDRLESGIRASNAPAATVVVPPRAYLGAFAEDAGRGVRVTSVRSGGPADRAGIQPRDLIVGAAGHKIQQLSQLTEILSGLKPGDHLSLELIRGIRPLPTVVILGAMADAAQSSPPAVPTLPPASGAGAGRTEPVPPPPGELPGPGEGPSLVPPANPLKVNPGGDNQSQVDELRHRVDQLEQEVKELRRQMAELQKK